MPKVLIYTTPNCIYCQMTKEFLKNHNINYEEKDVSTNDAFINEMISKSGQLGVPVIDIDGKIVVGFDQEKLAKLLNIK